MPEPRQAVILAAGEGRRLRPITAHTPKPLMPFLGVPMLDWAVAHLVRAGVHRIAINAFHLADAVVAHVVGPLARRFPQVELHVSVEPTLLGTGGALARLRGWLGRSPFVVVNADAVFAADLRAMMASHADGSADATWMVSRAPGAADLRTVQLDASGAVSAIHPEARGDAWTFCGVHIAGPAVLDRLPDDPSCVVRAGYLPAIAAGARVQAFETDAFWADTGTPERYVDAHREGLAAADALAPLGLWPDRG
ncbi:MAG: NTP transferase domain-containing protein [Deltaproteobacteria bacterium]|nr:NTP transferase domain-containing protein [Deltaproteobacteria bacterium]MCB9785915.1 NTP transferase domain-containing protein [Deltaproteobacteria bacterium]